MAMSERRRYRLAWSTHPGKYPLRQVAAAAARLRPGTILHRKDGATSAYCTRQTRTRFEARMALRPDWLPALSAFESAARHQNFAHAAEELHLTASAVSHHVRKLEARLGVALFQRHARGVSLTAEGRQLADAAS